MEDGMTVSNPYEFKVDEAPGLVLEMLRDEMQKPVYCCFLFYRVYQLEGMDPAKLRALQENLLNSSWGKYSKRNSLSQCPDDFISRQVEFTMRQLQTLCDDREFESTEFKAVLTKALDRLTLRSQKMEVFNKGLTNFDDFFIGPAAASDEKTPLMASSAGDHTLPPAPVYTS